MRYMTENLVRIKILKFYYDKGPRKCTSCKELIDILDVSYDEIKTHMFYLDKKGLLQCKFTIEGLALCRITSKGMDVTEHPKEDTSELPGANTIIVHGNVTNSPILQTKNLTIEIYFGKICNEIKESEFNIDEKNKLYDEIEELKAELSKNNPDLSKIRKISDYVKSRLPSTKTILTGLILKSIETYIENSESINIS
ncbi:MAG: hypothetical protein GQ533_11290 [Methanosarcinaceae archaeon]|nr:hypothetical protein [Methanosarcinaceae archaeon]